MNIPSIVANGLVVPEKLGVQVANGSVNGVGIYTAKTPSTSFSYSRDCDKMFVILGLLDDKVRAVNDICVIFDETRLMPLWIVEFHRHGSTSQGVPQQDGVKAVVTHRQ